MMVFAPIISRMLTCVVNNPCQMYVIRSSSGRVV